MVMATSGHMVQHSAQVMQSSGRAWYAGKYPFVAPYLKLILSTFTLVVSFLDKLIKKLPVTPSFTAASITKFYQVVPTGVWLVDNEKSFEHRQEIN